MALKVKQELVDEIIYEVYGGIPTNDRAISDNFVCRLLNNKIAEAAVKSAFGSYNLDGTVEADGIFRLTYTGLSLTTDTISGLKYFPLPAQPVGLPSNRSFIVYPPSQRGGRLSGMFKIISASEAIYIRSLPGIRKVFGFEENGNMYFIDAYQIMATYNSLNLSVVTSGANDLTAFVNLPDDLIAGIKMILVPQLKQMLKLQDDTPLPVADSPEPRGSA
jgi:hypothetical protein